MFLDDADRLAFIQGLGGQLVQFDGGSFYAIYARVPAIAGEVIETYRSILTARTSDLANVVKDTPVSFRPEQFRVQRSEPDDSGLTTLVLKR